MTEREAHKASCKSCRFWQVEDVRHGLAHGACKRYPPVPVWIDDDIEDRSPYMPHDDWCGEWAALLKSEAPDE